jgi:hypothetical protein
LSTKYGLIEAQLHSNWAPIANQLLLLKRLVVDYQRVTNPLIFAIFATKGNLARKYCKIRVKKLVLKYILLVFCERRIAQQAIGVSRWQEVDER